MKESLPLNDQAIENSQKKTPEQRRREKRWEDYESLKMTCLADPELSTLFENMEQGVLTYVHAIAKMNHMQNRMALSSKYDRTDLEQADRNRRTFHDSLIDKLNILSRAFVPRGLDNTWRKVVGLEHRNQVTDWAIDIAQFLTSDARIKNLLATERRE